MEKQQTKNLSNYEINDNYIYGRKPILELLTYNSASLKEIYLSSGFSDQQIKELIDSKKIKCHSVPTQDLDKFVNKANHQGIVAKIIAKQAIDLSQLIKFTLGEEGNKILLILDQIQDPHNLGAIFRVAEATGIDGIILSKANSSPITASVRKVSAGATEFLKYSLVSNLAQTIEKLKKEGFWILGTSLDEKNQSLVGFDFPLPIAIVLGSEGTGMRVLTKSLCDYLVQIPMQGKIQSLNVNQAASIVLFEAMKARLK